MSRSFLNFLSDFLSPPNTASDTDVESTAIHAYWQKRAFVTETIQPGQRGRIWFQATTWFAVCPYYAVLPPDTPVRVVGCYNTVTLIVEPIVSIVPASWSKFDQVV